MKKNCFKGRFCSKEGFTLIELLVVILIIGILAAVAVPQYQKAVLKSRYATLKNLTKSLADAQEVYYLQNGVYADSFDLLDISIPSDLRHSSSEVYCSIVEGDYQNITCRNTQIGMRYVIRQQHASLNPGQRFCIAQSTDETDMRNQLCQAETGNSSYSPNESFLAWCYK